MATRDTGNKKRWRPPKIAAGEAEPHAKKASTRNGSASDAVVGFEEKLWQMADKLRNNVDAADYKHVVLGLIFAVRNGTRIAPKGSTLVMVRGMGLHDGVRVSQAREDVTFDQDVKALVPRTIEADPLLFATLDAPEELHKRVETSGHGTGKVPSEILLAHPITMPSHEVQRKRGVHISAMNDRSAANRSESRSLAGMPRLLSGVLSVDVAAREVEAVV